MTETLTNSVKKYSRIIIFSFFFFLLIPRLHYYFFPFQNSISESPQSFFYFCALFTLFVPLIYIKSFKFRILDLLCLLFITILYFDLGFTIDFFKLSMFFATLILFNFCSDHFFNTVESFLKKDFVKLVTILALISLVLTFNDVVLWHDRSVAFVGNPTVWAIILLTAYVFNFTNNEKSPHSAVIDLLVSSILCLSVILTKSKLGFCLLVLLLLFYIAYFLYNKLYKKSALSFLKFLIFLAFTSQTTIVQQIINRNSESYFVRINQYKSYYLLENKQISAKLNLQNKNTAAQNFELQKSDKKFSEYDNQFLDLRIRTNLINVLIFIFLCFYSLYICFRIKSMHWFTIFSILIIYSLLNRILMYYPISMIWALFYSISYKKFLEQSHTAQQ